MSQISKWKDFQKGLWVLEQEVTYRFKAGAVNITVNLRFGFCNFYVQLAAILKHEKLSLRTWWQRQVTVRPPKVFVGLSPLSISNLETNPTAPNIFWSLTFRESVRNQLSTRERVR